MLADHVDRAGWSLDARVYDDTFARVDPNARAVGAEDPWLRDGRQAFPKPDVEMVERGCVQTDEDFARPGLRIGDVLEDEHLGAAVLMDPHRAHRGRLSA